jgi:hypothetical protein
MRQTYPLLVSGYAIKVESKFSASGQDHAAGGERADSQLWPLQVHENSDGPPHFLLCGADKVVALFMILMCAMAEV